MTAGGEAGASTAGCLSTKHSSRRSTSFSMAPPNVEDSAFFVEAKAQGRTVVKGTHCSLRNTTNVR